MLNRALLPGVSDPLLARLAYVFDYDHPALADPALRAALRAFVLAVGGWQAAWRPGRLTGRDDGATISIADRRTGLESDLTLTGDDAALWRHLDRARPIATLSSLHARAPERLDEWVARRWVVVSGERALGVVPHLAA